MPAARMMALNPSTYSVVYLWPVAGRDAGGEREVGGDLPEGHERQPEHGLEHVPAGGSLIRSGSVKIRCGLHQIIGSDGCIRYSTRVPSRGWPPQVMRMRVRVR